MASRAKNFPFQTLHIEIPQNILADQSYSHILVSASRCRKSIFLYMARFEPTQPKYNADVHSLYTKFQISTIKTEQMMAKSLYGLKLVSWRGLNGNSPYVHRFDSNVASFPIVLMPAKPLNPKLGWVTPEPSFTTGCVSHEGSLKYM